MPVPRYIPPLSEMQFALKVIAATADSEQESLSEAILSEAGKFATDVLSPLNWPADQAGGCTHNPSDYTLTTPAGWNDAYQQFSANGWMGIGAPEQYGGQAMPSTLSTLVCEMWHGANMAFGLCPMLSNGASDMLLAYGTEQQKNHYLRPLISGEWTGTMCLTEANAGSDLARIATRATPEADYFRIDGTKIYITYGEHDLTPNIIHTVLARLPDAPAGIKGLSLFIVPKFLLNPDGSLSDTRNDVNCLSIEHKLGIHGSPTCTMRFGENDGAIGYLLGEKNQGIKAMFTMMNAARFAVGVQGLGVARYAYQLARDYAAERQQGRGDVAINTHPDIQRMLLTMQAHDLSLRLLSVYYASLRDQHEHCPTHTSNTNDAFERMELLTPILKAHCTNIATDICTVAIHIFGGIGYVEESGVAQLLRDVTITKIYEGTNGIQALDLAFRKLQMGPDGQPGTVIQSLISECWNDATAWQQQASNPTQKRHAGSLIRTIEAWDKATAWMLQQHNQSEIANTQAAQLMASDYLNLMGLALQGWMAAKALPHCTDAQSSIYADYARPLHFLLDYLLHDASALSERIIHGELTREWLV